MHRASTAHLQTASQRCPAPLEPLCRGKTSLNRAQFSPIERHRAGPGRRSA